MAEHITLDTLMQSSGHTALQVQEPASVEAVRAQVEELSPEQRVRVEEVKNSIDLMDSQAVLQYGVGAQRNISSFSDNILTQVRSKDSGYVGELMSDLVLKVKEVDVDGLDEDIQRLAWEKHGFRTGVYDTPTDAAHFGVSGIAEELTQVAPMPDANTMDRIIKALS